MTGDLQLQNASRDSFSDSPIPCSLSDTSCAAVSKLSSPCREAQPAAAQIPELCRRLPERLIGYVFHDLIRTDRRAVSRISP